MAQSVLNKVSSERVDIVIKARGMARESGFAHVRPTRDFAQ